METEEKTSTNIEKHMRKHSSEEMLWYSCWTASCKQNEQYNPLGIPSVGLGESIQK